MRLLLDFKKEILLVEKKRFLKPPNSKATSEIRLIIGILIWTSCRILGEFIYVLW